MKYLQGKSVFIGGSLGTVLQLIGIIRLLTPRTTELSLFWAIVSILGGTLVWMASLESFSLVHGRSRLWCLAAPVGLGVALLFLCRGVPRPSISKEASVLPQRTLPHRIASLLLVACVTIGFVWAGSLWLRHDQWPRRPAPRILRKNEAATVARLREIAEAQQRYRESDWNGDGEKQYAAFLVHLWRSVDMSGRPIEVHLLPRTFAIAMSPAWALDGYYFTDLRQRELPRPSTASKGAAEQSRRVSVFTNIDLRRGWAVCASPAEYGETGYITFIVDQSGRIWGKETDAVVTYYPHEPSRSGWTELPDEEALVHLQDSITYEP